jgi:predicted tellurium resistance membrane protein TerC
MTSNLPVMSTAVILAVIVMLLFSGFIVRFIEANPTIKMLALSFLLMIGVVLVADGLGHHIEKGYIYFAMAFSLGVEMLNLRAARVRGGSGEE